MSATLESFLDRYCTSLLARCSGLTGQQLALRANVERTCFAGDSSCGQIDAVYFCAEQPDAAFDEADDALAARGLRGPGRRARCCPVRSGPAVPGRCL